MSRGLCLAVLIVARLALADEPPSVQVSGSLSKPGKLSGWKKAVLATAADGYQAVFSCAELAEEMGPTRALLVWKLDGKPIPPETGPFRLVVLTDKEPSRSVFGLQKLEVLNLAR